MGCALDANLIDACIERGLRRGYRRLHICGRDWRALSEVPGVLAKLLDVEGISLGPSESEFHRFVLVIHTQLTRRLDERRGRVRRRKIRDHREAEQPLGVRTRLAGQPGLICRSEIKSVIGMFYCVARCSAGITERV